MNNRLELVVIELSSIVAGCAGTQAEAFRIALAHEQIFSPHEEIRSVLGWPVPRAIRALLPTGMSLDADLERADRLQRALATALRQRFSEPEATREVSGTTEVLESLRAQGLRVALVTNLPRGTVDNIVESAVWFQRGLVDTVVAGDDPTSEREHADPVSEAMRRTRVADARNVVSLGESLLHLRLSDAAGCGAVVATAFERPQLGGFAQRTVTHAVIQRITAVLDVIALHDVGRFAEARSVLWPRRGYCASQ